MFLNIVVLDCWEIATILPCPIIDDHGIETVNKKKKEMDINHYKYNKDTAAAVISRLRISKNGELKEI